MPTSSHCEVTSSLEQVFVPRRGSDFRRFGAAVELESLLCPSAGIPCEPPPDIPNGEHTGRLLSEFHYGTAVTYSCKPGFPLHGEPSIHCTTRDGKNGVWSEPLPACGGGTGLGEAAGTPTNPPCWETNSSQLEFLPRHFQAEQGRMEGHPAVPGAPFPLEMFDIAGCRHNNISRKMIFRLLS